MDPLDEIILTNLLRTGIDGFLLQSENEKIEYKREFNTSSKESKAKYAKEIAALHNFKGGYLIFGIDDKTNKIQGLESFSQPDNASLSNDINNYFSPAISFETRVFIVDNKKLFIFYVHPRKSIPTVCIKPHQEVLKESTIYWRYNAISSPIRSGDLIHLLNSLMGEENRKQTEIIEKEFRSKHRPKLKVASWMSSPEEIDIFLENDGPIAYIDSLAILKKNLDSLILNKLQNTYPLKKNDTFKIPLRSYREGLNEVEFDLEVKFHDDENYNYRQIIHYESRKAILSKLEEIN